MPDTFNQSSGRNFVKEIPLEDAAQVCSFGLSHRQGCAAGCCPPVVIIALGINGEIDRPTMTIMDLAKAEDFVARVQLQISRARGEQVN